MLLLSSYVFYMFWKPEYALLIATSTLVDFYLGIQIGSTQHEWKRKLLLSASLVVNLGLLAFFKYSNFTIDSVNSLSTFCGGDYRLKNLDVLLPVGISFYTFQTLSYTIDVYRGTIQPQRDVVVFANYVSFFPQLVAGPIERADRLLPQLSGRLSRDKNFIWSGLRLVAWGFFKKMVVADRLAIYSNTVYEDIETYQGFPLIWATYFFAFQIYCDFSGYTDIAIGTARLMGVDLMKNFRAPYTSTSIQEFWSRWHISLSTWFRDYVYIPLGGNRGTKLKWYRNIFLTFVVSGLWHGAAWTFVIWGAIHGLGLLSERYLMPNKSSRGWSFLRWLFVFHFVVIGWIFFRANSVEEAFYALSHLHKIDSGVIGIPTITPRSFIECFIAIACVVVSDLTIRFKILSKIHRYDSSYNLLTVWLTLVVLAIYFFGVFEAQDFIYFQF